jgi:hypothetical protein
MPHKNPAEYMRKYRSDPFAAAVETWRNRTEQAAMKVLRRRYPEEFRVILEQVRAGDPRPGTKGARRVA